MARHVFIDNANVFGGAQRAAATLESGVHWCAVRVYYRNLFRLVEGDADVVTRVLAGPVPPGNDSLWDHARSYGYSTDLLWRIQTDEGRLTEQGVDEVLHLKIANAIIDYAAPQTLVIVSGDGAASKYDTSFPAQAGRALARGWLLEVWSWEAQLTGRYRELQREYPEKVQVRTLDPFYRSITFVKAGDYYDGDITAHIDARVVSPLVIPSPSPAPPPRRA